MQYPTRFKLNKTCLEVYILCNVKSLQKVFTQSAIFWMVQNKFEDESEKYDFDTEREKCNLIKNKPTSYLNFGQQS